MALRLRRPTEVLVATLAYVTIGLATAALAGAASSVGGVKAWRVAAWMLSIVVFLMHIYTARHRGAGRRSAALEVAAAVALSAFILALAGPVRSHWNDTNRRNVVALSLFLWPVLTGVPAFGVAWLAELVLDRWRSDPNHRDPVRPNERS